MKRSRLFKETLPGRTRRRLGPMAILILVLAAAVTAQGSAIIIDHTCADLAKIPEAAILLAKKNLHIAYGHTSHGSQLITGMSGLVAFMNGKGYPNNLYSWNETGAGGALHLDDSAFSGAEDLGNPNFTAWEAATRAYLSTHPLVNLVMWSWCGQVSWADSIIIANYLSLMNGLELSYPAVTFVYMTSHLDGTGAEGNLNIRNEQIRASARPNDKVLFDFADIESYDPDAAKDTTCPCSQTTTATTIRTETAAGTRTGRRIGRARIR